MTFGEGRRGRGEFKGGNSHGVPWSCTECSYENVSYHRRCNSCSRPKDGGGFQGQESVGENWRDSSSRGGFSNGRSRDSGAANSTDWYCSSCNRSNFASRQTCRNCNTDRVGSGLSEADQDSWNNRSQSFLNSGFQHRNDESKSGRSNWSQGRGSSQSGQSSSGWGSRSSDLEWECSGCNCRNFPSRYSCRQCGGPKDAGENVTRMEGDSWEPKEGGEDDWDEPSMKTTQEGHAIPPAKAPVTQNDPDDDWCEEPLEGAAQYPSYVEPVSSQNRFSVSDMLAMNEAGVPSNSSSSNNERNDGGRNRGRYESSYGSDWTCNSCSSSNYANRETCRSCGEEHDSGAADNSRGVFEYDSELIDWDKMEELEAAVKEKKFGNLLPIKKHTFVPLKQTLMTHKEASEFRAANFDMTVHHEGGEADTLPPELNPVRSFREAFHAYPEIMREIEKNGFETPTPIQAQAWPVLMQGHDMVGIAQTGTGKTLAFILPALIHIDIQVTPRRDRIGPTCLVIAPTRELAQQIESEINKYNYKGIGCVCVYGQGAWGKQAQKIRNKVEIVVATPGRLCDFQGKGVIDLRGVSYLVLDEADRMLDMGFAPDIRKIVVDIRPDRQTVLTSATWPEGVRELGKKLLKDPIHVVVGSLDLRAVTTVTQHVICCNIADKEAELLEFLQQMTPEDKAIVFVGRKTTVDQLSVALCEMNIDVVSMHGGREQCDREQALDDLKTGRCNVLIATDVASRGIDITDITKIFNYDCPKDMEEYVHRVGRTGRAGKRGDSFTLVTREDWRNAGKLIEIMERANQIIPNELVRMKERFEAKMTEMGGDSRGGGRGSRGGSSRYNSRW